MAVRSWHLRGVAASVLAVTLATEIAAVALSWGLEPAYDTFLYAVYAVTLAGAGALIVSRHPGHRIGWLFCATALLNGFAADLAQGWGLRAAKEGWPAGPFAEWIALCHWIVAGPALVSTFLLFPDGHLYRRGWQAVAWINVMGVALLLPGWAMSPDLGELFVADRNPYAVDSPLVTALVPVGMALFLGSTVAAGVPLIQRLRHSVGVERLQLRWFAFVSLVAVIALPTAALLWNVAPVVRLIPALVLTAMPVAAGVAILRYRLYDIDLVISRTVSYSALTVTLAGTYALAVVVVGAAVGRNSAWTTAGATLAVAAAFGPLRHRLQDVVDRRFNRARFDALQQMSRFLDDLRAGRAAPEDVERVLRDALGVGDLEVRLSQPGSGFAVDLSGTPVVDDPDDGRDRWLIRHGGTTLGTVVASADLTQRGSLVPKLFDAGRVGGRDRQAARRAAPPTRGGGGLTRPDRRCRRRRALPHRTGPPRRRATAPGVDRPCPAPRPTRPRNRSRS